MPLLSSSVANAQSRCNGTSAGPSSHSGRLPPLTTNECRLLSENEGCFKCRSFFIKCHTSSNEHEFHLPIGNGYKELTMSDVDSACKLRGPTVDSNKKPRTGPIATITAVDENNNNDMVASIIPSAVLGNGTDSEEESNKQLSIPPLTKYVFLKVGSIDGSFTSRKVSFIIAPRLCTQLLLGLPWLSHNHIVIDYASRSCVHKPSGVDLLTHPSVTRMFSFKLKSVENVHTSLHKSGNKAKEARKKLLVELKELIASIREQIENLATLSSLHEHESRLKQKYHSIFEPIPHVDDLPTTVTAKIQLIDASKSIASRSYHCP
ncbi:hypothetical protein EV359DRAFT_79684 [Lentinula novae-zelandiae]|nr:hypothetical protein EV359DRAFT_79684 [Lentinula novae-zelandiae]